MIDAANQLGGQSAHYGDAFNAGNLAAGQRSRRMDAINTAANETAALASRLDQLLARLAGPRAPQTAAGGQNGAPITVSYSSALDRLADNLNRASATLAEIEDIA